MLLEAAPPQLDCLGSGVLCGRAFILAGFDSPASRQRGDDLAVLALGERAQRLGANVAQRADLVAASSFGASDMTIASYAPALGGKT